MKKLFMILLIILTLSICSSIQALTDSEMENIWNECEEWTEQSAAFEAFIQKEGIQYWVFHLQVNAYFENLYGTPDTSAAREWWDEKGWYEEPQIEWIVGWWHMWESTQKYYHESQWS